MSNFAHQIKRAVSINDGAIAEAIAEAELAEYHTDAEIPEDAYEDYSDKPITEAEIHEEVVEYIHASVDEAAQSIEMEYRE